MSRSHPGRRTAVAMPRTLLIATVTAGLSAAGLTVVAGPQTPFTAGAAAQDIAADRTPPRTSIIEAPAEGSTIANDAPRFGWEADEANSTFACTADGVVLRSCELAFVTGASPGPHTFTVAATDPAGNTDPTPATRSFRVSFAAGPTAATSCSSSANLIVATSGDDRRTGTARADRIFGLDGDDVLTGEAGGDCVYGGDGDDRLIGGRWNDLVVGGSGDDSIHGHADNDVLEGGTGNDRIVGGSGRDTLEGGAGSDRLSDHTGPDTFSGGTGNDRIDARDTTAYGRHKRDRVRCGSGRYDVALVDRRDQVARDCERVRRGRR